MSAHGTTGLGIAHRKLEQRFIESKQSVGDLILPADD
jgi:hypothetical protein